MPNPPVCPVCSAGQPAYLEASTGYQLFRCSACDLIFSDPMRAPGREWYAGAYLVRRVAVDDRIREYFRWALDRLPPSVPLLDVGCGEGTFVAYARSRGFDAWGIDFSPASIEAGRQRFRLTTLRVGSVEDLHADKGHFQAATAFEVLEHVESPAALLAAIRDVLRPGGDLILSVPNRDRWPIREFSDYPPNHLTRWSERALRRAAEEAGLSVLSVEQTSRWQSINALFGYGPRTALYWALGLRARGIGREANLLARMAGRIPVTGRIGSGLRRARDLAMWPPAIIAAPFIWRRCQGYNLMMHARRPSDQRARVGLR